MVPRHQSPRDIDRRSHAPYNFIPLPDKVVPAQDLPDQNTYAPDRKSGMIVCTLETKTPLYTRGALRPDFYKRFEQVRLDKLETNADIRAYAAFFRYDENGDPVISGSSLRGMVRSLCEILSHGKVQWVTDKKLIYRAVGAVSSVGDYYRERFFGKSKIEHQNGKQVTKIEYPAAWVRGGYLCKVGSDWYIQPAVQDQYHNSFIHVNYDDCVSAGLHGRVNYDANGKLDKTSTYGPKIINVEVKPAQRKWIGAKAYGPRNHEVFLDFCLAMATGIRKSGETEENGWQKGVLVLSHHFGERVYKNPKHRNIVIYLPDEKIPKDQWLPVSDEQMALLRDENDLPRNDKQKPRLGWLDDKSPVMYMVDEAEKVVFLGPTKMFRLPYKHTALDYVPKELRDDRMIDLPEAVFGFVRETAPAKNETDEQAKQRAYAGRVFFGDARLKQPVQQQPLMLPAVLSSPKPTSFQHYLVQQALNDTPQTKGKDLLHYDTNPGDTAIRGTKQYWHHNTPLPAHMLDEKAEDLDPRSDINKDDRKSRTIIRPVGKGADFEFCIRFENLTDEELGMLLWALEFPAAAPARVEYCHRLGMAKPLGLGSAKITPHLYVEKRGMRYASLIEEKDQQMVWSATQPDEDTDRKHYTDRFEAYVMQALGKGEKAFIEEARIQDLLIMLRFPGPAREDVRYATMEDEDFKQRMVLPLPSEVIQGGGGNPRQGGGGGGGQPRQGGGGNPGRGSGGGGGQPRQDGGGEQPRPGGSKDSGRLRSGDFLEELKRRQGG